MKRAKKHGRLTHWEEEEKMVKMWERGWQPDQKVVIEPTPVTEEELEALRRYLDDTNSLTPGPNDFTKDQR